MCQTRDKLFNFNNSFYFPLHLLLSQISAFPPKSSSCSQASTQIERLLSPNLHQRLFFDIHPDRKASPLKSPPQVSSPSKYIKTSNHHTIPKSARNVGGAINDHRKCRQHSMRSESLPARLTSLPPYFARGFFLFQNKFRHLPATSLLQL